MKTLTTILCLALFTLPSLTHAQTLHRLRSIQLPQAPVEVPSSTGSPVANPTPTPTPTPSPTPPPTTPVGTASNHCINGFHDNPTTVSAITAEAQAIKNHGFLCVRIAYAGFNNPTSELQATISKSLGLYVILGGGIWVNGGPTIGQADLPTYTAALLQQMKWCQANGIPQCSEGNEQEPNLAPDLTVCQWNSYLGKVTPQSHALYSGIVSYEMNSQYESTYIGCGKVQGLLYGLNLYGGYTYNKNAIQQCLNAFGSCYVSETNCDMDNPNTGCAASDATHAAEVKGDMLLLWQNFPTIPIYAFTWAADGSFGVPAHWGLSSEPLTLSEI